MPLTIPATRAPRGAVRRRMLLAPLCVVIFAGCVEEPVAPHVPVPPKDATPLFWSLRNDHRAVTLSTVAPHDTLRIRAVPHDGAGRPLSLEGSVTYASTQPTRAVVSDAGLIRAIAPGTNIFVISTFVVGNVRHVDTTVVNVTTHASPSTAVRFSVQPVAPDSARWFVEGAESLLGINKRLPLRIENAAGQPITGVAVRYTSSDPALVPINAFNGAIASKRLGRATFTAEATIYGTKWADSVEFEFDWMVYGYVQVIDQENKSHGLPIRLGISPSIFRIGKGGAVAFQNSAGMPVGIVFDDPTHVEERTSLGCPLIVDVGGRGNIAPFGDAIFSLAHCRSRRFPVPGVYTYRSTRDGATGTIIVEESAL